MMDKLIKELDECILEHKPLFSYTHISSKGYTRYSEDLIIRTDLNNHVTIIKDEDGKCFIDDFEFTNEGMKFTNVRNMAIEIDEAILSKEYDNSYWYILFYNKGNLLFKIRLYFKD